MKKILLLVIFCSIISTAYSQTNVSGTLSSNTTWTKANSPYILTSTVGVPSSTTLTIEPGVSVSGNFDIIVKGKIIALGNSSDYITLNNVRILFKSCDLSKCNVSFLKFKSGGIQLADESEFSNDNPKNSDTLNISNCEFSSSAYARTKGYSSSAHLRIKASNFINSTILGYYPRSEKIQLISCEIVNSTIQSDSYNYGIMIDSSNVESSKLLMGCCDANFQITNSTIKKTTATEGGGSPVNGNFIIKNSIFDNSPVSLPNANITLENSIVYNNGSTIINSSWDGQYYNSPAFKFGNGTIKNCSFYGTLNTISLYITGYYGYNVGGATSISNSNFFNDSTAILVNKTNSFSVSESNFIGQTKNTLINYSAKDITAQNNYWETVDNSIISGKIYDIFDNINSGEVNFSSFKTSPSIQAPISAPSNLVKKDSSNGVFLKWNKNKESDVAGYKVYYGAFDGNKFASSVDVGSDSSYLLSGKTSSDLILITAYDTQKDGVNDLFEGHESWYSNDALPVAKILNGDSVTICQGAKVVLRANKSNSYKYTWLKDGVIITGANNDSLEVTNSGKYQVKVININNVSATSNNFQVKVNQLIVQNTNSTSVCKASLALQPSISYTGSNNLVYSWDADTTLSAANIKNPVINIISSHTYKVSISDNICSAKATITVTVSPLTVNAGNDKSFVCGGKVQFDNPITNYTGSGLLSYSWLPKTGLDSSKLARPTAEITYNAKYVLTITTSNGCVAKDSINVLVNPLTVTANNISISCGNRVNLNAITNYTGSGNLSYNWSPALGLSDTTIKNPIANCNKNTIYSVQVKTPNGCKASTSLNFNTTSISFNPSICLVTVSENNKNVIVWQRTANSAIDSFYVYRESSNQTDKYDLIGKLPYLAQGIFTDTMSNAKVQSNKYKIATKDICGYLTSQSSEHKTMHLTINKGIGTKWNLIWEPYVGQAVSSYKIYRGTSKANLSQIGSTSGSNTTYTDETAPEGMLYYVIEVVLPQACGNLKSTGYENSRSNIMSTINAGRSIQKSLISESFIYPNPAFDKLNISKANRNAILSIFDLQGKLALSQKIKSGQVDISTLPKGVYTVKLIDSGNVLINKLIKE